MKKSLLVVCAILSLVSVSAYAAAAPGMGYMVGFKNADYDVDGSSTSSKPGLMAGVIMLNAKQKWKRAQMTKKFPFLISMCP
jgi:hypothetical protein